MATHSSESSSESSSEPSSAQAREALGLLDLDGSRLAARLVTPWWYHVALGGIVASIVVAMTLPGSACAPAIAVGVLALLALPVFYRRRYGVSVTEPAGPGSRRLMLVLLGAFVLAMAGGLAVKLAGLAAWWVLLPAAVVWAATVVLGRRYDDALRGELAGGGRG